MNKANMLKIVSNTLSHKSPLYVQYYITARCNLRCEQRNVIFANADRQELGTEAARSVIRNLGELGTSVLLLTGGEPFVRSDLPLLARTAIESGIHPRIQTNGLASQAKLQECADYGVRDISISLDTLVSSKQDFLNGDFSNSWLTAIQTVANVGSTLGKNTFAAFGCVFSPHNFRDVPNVIRFATEIGWWVSLVPAHSTEVWNPRSFSTFNNTMKFTSENINEAREILNEVREMKASGYHVYDSDQFLKDLENFISEEPLTWRDRNMGLCDAGSLYFAVLPDGSFAPCCDWRLDQEFLVQDSSFISNYRTPRLKTEVISVASKCNGCLYGSYPEITISARFAKATLERFQLFFLEQKNEIQVLTSDELQSLANKIIA